MEYNVQKELDNLLEKFYTDNEYEPFYFNFEIVDDLYQRRYELEENDKSSVLINKHNIENFNGTIVLRKNIKDTPYILLSSRAINDSMQYFGTVIHELTHIYDFWEYAEYTKSDSLKELESSEYIYEFYYWTEFHAKRNGYKYYRNFMWDNFKENDIQTQFSHIKNTELPKSYNDLRISLSKSINDETQYLYKLIHFFARYSIWNDLFPGEFNIDKLYFPLFKFRKLYAFLYDHCSFESIINEFEQFRKILSEITC